MHYVFCGHQEVPQKPGNTKEPCLLVMLCTYLQRRTNQSSIGQQAQNYIKSLGKALRGAGHQKWGRSLPHCTSVFQISAEEVAHCPETQESTSKSENVETFSCIKPLSVLRSDANRDTTKQKDTIYPLPHSAVLCSIKIQVQIQKGVSLVQMPDWHSGDRKMVFKCLCRPESLQSNLNSKGQKPFDSLL